MCSPHAGVFQVLALPLKHDGLSVPVLAAALVCVCVHGQAHGIHTHTHTYTHVRPWIILDYMYVCMYVCVYDYIHVYIYIYINLIQSAINMPCKISLATPWGMAKLQSAPTIHDFATPWGMAK